MVKISCIEGKVIASEEDYGPRVGYNMVEIVQMLTFGEFHMQVELEEKAGSVGLYVNFAGHQAGTMTVRYPQGYAAPQDRKQVRSIFWRLLELAEMKNSKDYITLKCWQED